MSALIPAIIRLLRSRMGGGGGGGGSARAPMSAAEKDDKYWAEKNLSSAVPKAPEQPEVQTWSDAVGRFRNSTPGQGR